MKKPKFAFVERFDWGLYPEAEKFLHREVTKVLKNNTFARRFAQQLKKKTSTQLFDWIDHIVLPRKRISLQQLRKYGFEETLVAAPKGMQVLKNGHSTFFPILLSEDTQTEIAIKVESLEAFGKKQKKNLKISGKKFAPYRHAQISKQNGFAFAVVERRGAQDFLVSEAVNDIQAYKETLKMFKNRKRTFHTDKEGMEKTHQLIVNSLKKLRRSRAADAFFHTERLYWMQRNKAGRLQKRRQDILGLGWGNHDHHTYRSSRENFKKLIHILEDLGCVCRERFYAGEHAGWGAQVMEQPFCNIGIFADVDVSLKEKDKDFAHLGLKEKKKFGTVGLWIALHGESMLEHGMHHLAGRFSFKQLEKDLAKNKITFMKPFSHFPFLKQSFSIAEQWKIEPKRLRKVWKEKMITQEQFDTFRKKGAVGSHLENLQRKQGFKGFNQDSVTVIIKAIDPRKQKHRGA